MSQGHESFTYEGSFGDLTFDSHLRALTGIRPYQ